MEQTEAHKRIQKTSRAVIVHVTYVLFTKYMRMLYFSNTEEMKTVCAYQICKEGYTF